MRRDAGMCAVVAANEFPKTAQGHARQGSPFYTYNSGNHGDSNVLVMKPAVHSEGTAQSGRLVVIGVTFTPTMLISPDILQVDVTVRNDSSVVAKTQGPDPGFTYNEGDDETSRGYPSQTGKWRVGVNFGASELPYGRYPYRWGLGGSLQPGESRTITGYIRLTKPKTQDYWVGLVQEGKGWYDEGIGRTTINVLPPTPTNKVDVYVLNFDPLIDGQPLTQYKAWNQPDTLMPGYTTDVLESSSVNVMYRIDRETVIRAYPPKADGFVYTNEQYLECVENPDAAPYCRAGIDYRTVLNTRYDPDYVSACEALATRGVDEIWLWGGPWFGYHEFLVVRPDGINVNVFLQVLADLTTFEHGLLAFRNPAIDASVQLTSLCEGVSKQFTVMGFSYEREVAEMLHNLAHRAESVLGSELGLTLWDQFDGQRQRYAQDYACPPSPDSGHPGVDPNNTHCGNVHFPPNAYCQYQYDRDLPVQSDCADWLNYPNLTGQKRTVNFDTWGGNQSSFLQWWLGHFPHNPGIQNDIYNNWWKYIFPVLVPCPDYVEPLGVGVEDIQAFAARWRQQDIDLAWDARFDLDEDGDTDIVDIMGAVAAWDTTCPYQDHGSGSKIAFESQRDGQSEIYVVNPDGMSLARITNDLAFDGHPGWSPDGERIVFMSQRDGNPEIYIMNADGSGVTRLTDHPAYDGEPVWSPNGLHIVFHSDRDGPGEIYQMSTSGTELINLTASSFGNYGPWWSPDGQQIAFVSVRDGYNKIYIMSSDGSNSSCLTCNTSISEAGMPSWSPNGRHIAFHGKTNGKFDIYVIKINGTGLTNITNHPAEDLEPSWSPDGQYIAFSSDRSGNQDIYAIKVDGTGLTRITNHPADDYNPAWSVR